MMRNSSGQMKRTLSFLEKKKFPPAARHTPFPGISGQSRKNYFSSLRRSSGQMKIQQMAFMIVGVLFFFILVGLFFLGWQYKDLRESFENLQEEQAIASLEVIANMPEFNCESGESLCLDEDKLRVLSDSSVYDDFWPVESIRVYKVFPSFDSVVECPDLECNYYEIYDSGQRNVREYSSYVSICQTNSEQGYVYEDCEIGKLVVGARLIE